MSEGWVWRFEYVLQHDIFTPSWISIDVVVRQSEDGTWAWYVSKLFDGQIDKSEGVDGFSTADEAKKAVEVWLIEHRSELEVKDY